MNIFQANYDTRLYDWRQLRLDIQDLDLQTKCVEIDKWWQRAPLVNHYLHPDFVDDWPDPWDLLVENTYCTLARGLGMVYTLSALGVHSIELVEAKDYNKEDVYLVLVDKSKYILNYWPDTVLNNKSSDFSITKHINVENLLKRVRIF